MKMILTGNIDVTKINKERLYKGKNGTYLNFTIVLNTDKDKYENNGFISESIKKEERDAGVVSTILGNLKILKVEGGIIGSDEPINAPKSKEVSKDFEDDLPF